MFTMERTLISRLIPSDKQILVQGWLHTIRDQKTMQFLVIRDHTGLVQVAHPKSDDALSNLISSLTVESAVEVMGKVVANDKVKLGQREIVLETINVVNMAPAQLPINADSALDLRQDWRFLDLRRPSNLLIFRVQTAIEQAMREWWLTHGFLEIHSPKLTVAATESGAELFRLPYFDGEACLAQSPQFFKQMAMAAGFDRVFEIGPVFRANPSFTSRHDTEFTSVDAEMSWIESHKDIMAMEEEWLNYVIGKIHYMFGEEIRKEFGVEVVVPTLPFPRVTMEEACEMLADYGHVAPPETKGDLDPEGERLLCNIIKDHCKHEFVFVTDYPVKVRAFYHMRYEDRPGITKSFDLLWKGLEVTTGAQREHRYDVLLRQVLERGMNPDTIKKYLECFQYGCPPHGGFGFGLTRMLMLLMGFKNVREVTYLYRGPNRLEP